LKPNDPSTLLPGLPQGAPILIVRLRSLGDMVLETPAIAALHAWRPDLRICVLAESGCAAVLEGNPAISEVLVSRAFLATALRLRHRRFPIVFNQHGGPRSALLTAASGAPWRVCWKGFQFSFFYNVLAPDKAEFFGTSEAHTVEHRISQFYWTGLPRGPIPCTQVFPQPDAAQSVSQKLEERGIAPGEPYAVLQIGARLPAMRWPVEKFAEIARWLLETHGIASVANLGPRDDEIAADLGRAMRGCATVLESINARELIALIAVARLFVGNDSGPAHIAAAARCSCVVIFGATSPVEWHPWQAEHRIVHTGAVFHSRRGDKNVPAGQSRSIHTIGVDEVRKACEALLARGTGVAKPKSQRV
jgi:heptosyltransferase-3